jgi:hypothetical protein
MSFDRIKRNIPIVILLFMMSSMAFICIDAERDNPNDPGSSSYNKIDKIYLFNAGTTDGDMGGRPQADSQCYSHLNRPAACKHACFAFISSDSSHQIRDLTSSPYNIPNAPFYGPDGNTKIADSWDDLLNGDINPDIVGLWDAGVLDNVGDRWWSGSNQDGTLHTDNCSGWTTNGGAGPMGRVGWADRTDSFWIADTTSITCSTSTYYLLCICY